MKPVKIRLDVLLVERRLAPTRQRARALIMAGKVCVDDRTVDKPGTRIAASSTIRLRVPDHPYVSRGGVKLEGALDDLSVDVTGLDCLDIGSSTGGFTDCLLRHGAARVVAVDVGTNQLDWSLRNDPRIEVHEQTDIRTFDGQAAGPPFSLAVIDVSFISLRLVLPPAVPLVQPGGHILAMLKPQFEVGRERVGKGGVVKDDAVRAEAIAEVREFAEGLGLQYLGGADSRIRGAKKGNLEHFLLWSRTHPCQPPRQSR